MATIGLSVGAGLQRRVRNKDTNMASQMVEFTKNNILVQSATSTRSSKSKGNADAIITVVSKILE